MEQPRLKYTPTQMLNKIVDLEKELKACKEWMKNAGHSDYCSEYMMEYKYEVDCICKLDKLLKELQYK